MASSAVRTVGWIVVADIVLVLFLVALGLGIAELKIPAGDGLFTTFFGSHGILFNFLLPLAIYSAVPLIIVWLIVWLISELRRPD